MADGGAVKFNGKPNEITLVFGRPEDDKKLMAAQRNKKMRE